MNDITSWLEELGLGRYSQVFLDNDVDLRVLPKLTDEDLKELGVSLGHRRLLQAAILDLDQQAEAPAPTNADEAKVAAAKSNAERRQLTVMFCDLLDSTRLSQRLDPEDLSGINRAFQETCTAAIQRFEGYVARYMGDGLLSYFGYPQAHEDDAERAIRAGLEVIEKVRLLGESLNRDLGMSLCVRVGIATGPVVVGELIGTGSSQESTVVGETPNLAARLQAEAEPNTLVIASSTRQLVGDLFDCRDRGERSLKGIRDPVRIWAVTGEVVVESRFEAKHPTALTPLVGRNQEIALLFDRWQQAKDGDGQVVLLSGEAGIGKSRVVQELRASIPVEDAIRLRYQCSPYHTSSALFPVINQLEQAARITRHEDVSTKLDKLESLLRLSTIHLSKTMPLFARLLSIPTEERYQPLAMAPEQQKEETLKALVEQLKNLSSLRPVVMIFEDIHWADPTSLELLNLVIEEVPQLRVLVLITFRPEFICPWADHAHITNFTLNRFSKGRVAALMENVAGGKALPEEVCDQIIAKTDGVPLFVEELTKTVLESDLVEDKGDRYVLKGALPSLAIPNTLQDSLMARLDRLGSVKETAQIAALLGRDFSHEILTKVARLETDEVTRALTQLAEAGLIYTQGKPPNATYTFKHAMVQETAYESLLKSKRQELHAGAASILEEENVEPEIVAHHFTEAKLFEPAVKYWLKAGQRALERSANVEAVTHLQAGLYLLQSLPESIERSSRELELLLVLGPALMATKGYAAAEVERVYFRARELGREVGDSAQSFAATWGLWLQYQQGGKLRQARELTEDVLAIAQKQQDTALRLQAHHAAWATFHRLGELDVCLRHAQEGAVLYDIGEHGSHAYLYGGHDPGVCAQTHAAIVLWGMGFADSAVDWVARSLELSEQLAHPFSRVDALFGDARVRLFRKEYGLAQVQAREMVSLSIQHGFSLLGAWGRIIEGSAVINERKSTEPIGDMHRGLEITRDSGNQAHVPFLLSLLIEAYWKTDQIDAGLETAEEAVNLIEDTGERNWEAEIHRLKGELLLKQAERDEQEAENCFERTLQIASAQNARSLELRGAMSLSRLWLAQDNKEKALNLLLPVYNSFTEGFGTVELKQAKAIVDTMQDD